MAVLAAVVVAAAVCVSYHVAQQRASVMDRLWGKSVSGHAPGLQVDVLFMLRASCKPSAAVVVAARHHMFKLMFHRSFSCSHPLSLVAAVGSASLVLGWVTTAVDCHSCGSCCALML